MQLLFLKPLFALAALPPVQIAQCGSGVFFTRYKGTPVQSQRRQATNKPLHAQYAVQPCATRSVKRVPLNFELQISSCRLEAKIMYLFHRCYQAVPARTHL